MFTKGEFNEIGLDVDVLTGNAAVEWISKNTTLDDSDINKITASAVLLAFVYYIFIVTNHFAPAGLNGIATMIQYKTGFSISYMSLLINIPLSVLAYFLVQKDFAVKTLLFSVVYSVSFLLLQNSDLSFIQYNALGHDTIYPVVLSGVLAGVVYGICFRNNAKNSPAKPSFMGTSMEKYSRTRLSGTSTLRRSRGLAR